jgi:hypothetical protein
MTRALYWDRVLNRALVIRWHRLPNGQFPFPLAALVHVS